MRHPMNEVASDPMETASRWMMKAEAGLTAREESQLDAWLEADSRHRAAYDAVLAADNGLLRHASDPAIMAMRHAALRTRSVRRAPPYAIAAGLAAAILATGVTGLWQPARLAQLTSAFGGGESRTSNYVTSAGERATVTLDDGSVLALNTDSAAEVVFDRNTRTVRLLKGQALFNVAHDPNRPFEVLADHRRVTAVGTSFDVLLLSGTLRVAMLDGVVRVESERPAPPETLSRGEIMTVRADGGVSVRKGDTARLAEWRDGVVYFENTPLEDAAAEMSRYAERPIVVAGRRARSLKVSGAFRTTDADGFAGTMTDLFPVSIDRSVSGRTTLIDAPA